jgi:imidazolonepropionase-like amidohydrolase
MHVSYRVAVLAVLALFACDLGRAADLALTGAKIYPSPTERAIEDGVIVIHDGRIRAVGPTAGIEIPRGAVVIACKGMVVTAGFWNSHVHLLAPNLLRAESLSSEAMTSRLQDMLTGWGFTTVFDIASAQDNTSLIRERIETGAAKGPRILTVGEPFWMKGGTPVYVKGFLEANQIRMPEVESTSDGIERVREQVGRGADGIKIFANSVEADGILTMPLDLARALATEAHRAGKPVFAHVANSEGIDVALRSGVDVLAHTTPADGPWSASLVARLIADRVALTPTLALWEAEFKQSPPEEVKKGVELAAGQLGAFSRAGGQVLFGTDVGYIDRYDTSEELAWMARAGMNPQQILASLTTNPAQRFGRASHSGRIAKGMDGDLVVLDADPARDATAFSHVRYTIRDGKVIYAKM